MAAKKAKKSSNKGPGSDFGPLLSNPKPVKPNSGPTRSQQQASRILFGPQNANIQEMGVGGYKSAIVRAAQALSRRVLPKEVGIHHSVTGPDGQLFRGAVRASGTQGRTAMDQIPGNSYFWSTKGKQGAAKAAKEAEFQTRNIAENWLLDQGTRASAYVTKVPRGTSAPDMNVPGSRARTVVGGQQIVRGVAGTGPVSGGTMSSLSASDLAKLTAGVKRAKAFEAASSTAKIAGIVATPSVVAGRALQAGTPNSSRNTTGRQGGTRTRGSKAARKKK